MDHEPFTGKVDQVRVLPRALSSQEMLWLQKQMYFRWHQRLLLKLLDRVGPHWLYRWYHLRCLTARSKGG